MDPDFRRDDRRKHMEHAIVLPPEILGYIKGFPITNTLLVAWITMAVIIVISFLATWKIKLVPSGLQGLFEMVIDFAHTTVYELAGDKKTKVFFPIVMTFFLFILFANFIGLLPGFATIKFHGEPLLRSMNSDLNMTLALALTSAVLTHIFALYYLGIVEYLKKWFTLNPIFLFVGLLELVGEFTKIVSLSFRLFGNIFAGEVVLATISSIFAFVVPLPFYFLEIIVGFVQAAVFMMLTLVFLVLLSEKHAAEH
ncbi:ATP synthase F0 subunit A [Candidatus Daviesbacteria bacterium RIFCSPLOWO2_02_FULL_41_8]|uniref:ATP synthase subunit a n=3 Tax=Candidatus Daviesiibacteriota TaxID=1752718 RepID=A0A1F5NHJ0_9BACT|nr:MAG: ATP synthase F0 subunit A [Candidatus Daviesbacteria bacterium RIFCSPHIGHO2_01_FULL_41_23]OGE32637.1 MAG: ATP synthase F0 subunit A [Candidatus Daviesbacteria bacterium RIFCSPHIGHO2_02_FULL_41_10]OGE62489.1 MAG: ATP synthase F0 subunit A [Candidatus Daviesbacteria bacterium RIFCSPLOWO2_01_FULL_41_32]OGE77156.1 MAG: ATP synthase F0 subunit A [Candidatus Daviesbacteria bacterium RIFCSPLOWO2_02_FULL_41_8]